MQVTIILLKSNWDFPDSAVIKTVCSQCRAWVQSLVEKYPTCHVAWPKKYLKEKEKHHQAIESDPSMQDRQQSFWCPQLFSSPFGSCLFLFFPCQCVIHRSCGWYKVFYWLADGGREVKTRILKYISHQNLAFKSLLAVNFERIQRRFINIIRGYTRHSRSW